MTDKLNEDDVMTVDIINEALAKLKLLKPKMKPVDVDGRKYYFWIKDKDGGWIPSDDPGAKQALLGVMGENWFYENHNPSLEAPGSPKSSNP